MCFQMDDIDAMFSEMLGEMDLLTKVSQRNERRNPPEKRFVIPYSLIRKKKKS